MHGATAQHRAIRRSNAQLDARDPSLIDLPLPVDSIPVLGPVLTPLIGGNDGGNTPQPTTSPTPNPNPDPNPGPSPSPSPSPNSSPSPPPPAADGNSGGNGGNTDGNGGGDTPMPAPPVVLANGGGTAVPPSPAAPNPTPPASTPGKSSPPGTNNANGDGSVSSVTGVSIPPSDGNSHASGSGNTLPVVENDANPTNPAGLGGSNPDAFSTTGFPSPSQSLLRSGSHTAGAVSPQSTGSGTGANSSGKLLSGGAIAGIIILCSLFLFALILVIVRRRSIARRMELRKQWFGRSALVGRLSVLNITARRNHVDSNGEVSADRRSTRSSFATTYDQGLAFGADFPQWPSVGSVPGLPPMAQVRERNSVLMSTGGEATRRVSLNSMLSNGNDPDTQYLIYSPDYNISDLPSPMSVRPFSPSESFSFPKPPVPLMGNADSPYIGSLRSSMATLVNLAAPSRALTTPPVQPQALIPSDAVSPSIAVHNNYFINPFADPVKPEATDVEVVRRSFEPSLDDELAVRPGDHVHVLRVFHDGWAFVEKFVGTKGESSKQGLVPIDCLSDGSQTPPVFFAL